MNHQKIYILQFADDQVVTVHRTENVKKYGKWGLMNIEKTKYLGVRDKTNDIVLESQEMINGCIEQTYTNGTILLLNYINRDGGYTSG